MLRATLNDPTINNNPTGSVTITGTAIEGETLTLVTTTLSDADGLGDFSYQWLRDGVEITSGTGSTDNPAATGYPLTSEDVGAEISVRVSYTDAGGTDEAVTSAATNQVVAADANNDPTINNDPTGSVTITGTAIEGETLTLVTTTLSDADGLGDFSYQWLRDGVEITSGTGSTDNPAATGYPLTSEDVGAEISVRVSYTDAGGTDEAVTSAATNQVVAADANNDPTINNDPTGSVTITGTAIEGETLTLVTTTLSDADGLGDFSYQWLRDGVEITSGTGSTDNPAATGYPLTSEDVGAEISVRVSYTDAGGTDEAVTSAATNQVVAADANNDPTGNSDPTGSVTGGADLITGSALNDTINALGGDDTINGLNGDDLLLGGGGNDNIKGGGGDDRLRGNGGDDTLKGGGGDDNIKGGGGSDNIKGNGGSDAIKAGGGADTVKGGGGADVINGGGGDDVLQGGGGNDTITGKGGDDTLKGNGGADVFQFRASDRNDTILDFRQGQDLIEIQNGANSFAALDIEQDGQDVLIGFGTGQVRVVTDSVGAFDENDFIF